MSTHYVKIIDCNRLTPEEAENIRDLELETYEQRFPERTNEPIEVYKIGTLEECETYRANLNELRDLFETVSFSNN